MAKQSGILPIEGTLGNITFFKTKDGYMVREKGGVSAHQIATDPAFQRTRENGAEFGRAGKAGKVLRTSMRNLLQKAADSRMVSRLTAMFIKVIQMDSTNTRGQRNVIDGEATLLEGFDFNVSSKLNTTFVAPYSTTINRTTGAVTISIPPFVPQQMVAVAAGSTHFRLLSCAAVIDFEGGTHVSESGNSTDLPISNVATTAIELTHALTANSTHPIFAVLGIEFLQEVNGQKYSLNNGSYNALAVIKVDA